MIREEDIRSETIFSGRIFTVVRKTVRIESGAEVDRELVYHPGGACVLAFTPEDEIFLVKQYRIAVGDFLLELPAGKLDKGEDPEVCARRELIEECGREAGTLHYLALVHPTPGYSSEPIHIYWTDDLREVPAAPDEGEILETIRLPFTDALNMVLEGKITDSKTQIGILKAALLRDRKAIEQP